jgi:hypothetical protein
MANYVQPNNQTVSVGDWFVTILLSSIPMVGFIMLLVWAFGGGAKESKKNYARAALIFAIIGMVVGIISSIIFSLTSAAFLTWLSNSASSYSYYS